MRYQADKEQNHKNEEQYLRNTCRRESNGSEAQ
jgi:hypothetical protein